MTADFILKILNSSVVTLILGSGIGWCFLNFCWEPWKRRSDLASRRAAFRNETEFRLLNIHESIGIEPTYRAIDGGELTCSLEPAYKGWNLYGLIFSGWGREVYLVAFPLIDAIKLDTLDDRNDPEKVKIAKAALQKLKSTLGLTSIKE
jgi:hypothetical protein